LKNPLSSNVVKKIVIETQNDTFGFAEYADEYAEENEDA
jgi:hypothetical protein